MQYAHSSGIWGAIKIAKLHYDGHYFCILRVAYLSWKALFSKYFLWPAWHTVGQDRQKCKGTLKRLAQQKMGEHVENIKFYVFDMFTHFLLFIR